MMDEYCHVCKEFHPHAFVSIHEYLDKEIKREWRYLRRFYNSNGKPLDIGGRFYVAIQHTRIDTLKETLEEFAY